MGIEFKNTEDQVQQEEKGQHQTQKFGPGKANRLMASRHFRRNRQGELLSMLEETMSAILARTPANAGFKFTGHMFDAKQYGLYYSVFAVSMAGTLEGYGKVASYFTFILEGSNAAPAPLIEQHANREVSITRTPMDGWDANLNELIYTTVKEALQVKDPKMASAAVVSSVLQLDSEEVINNLLWNAEEAMWETLKQHYSEAIPAYNIDEQLQPNDKNFIARFSNRSEDYYDITGFPVRSNLSMRLESIMRNRNRSDVSNFMHQSGEELMNVNAYVDFVYAPTPPTTNQFGQVVSVPQTYAPRVVITEITNGNDAPLSLETYLLALGTYAVVSDNYSWAGPFLPKNKDDLHDIGTLGYRAPHIFPEGKPGKIDTKSNSFGPKEAFDLIRELVYATPAFSIDCAKAGAYSWITDVFVSASGGGQEARQAIINAVSNLTGLNFGKMLGDDVIVVSEGNSIQLATFESSVGQRKVTLDAREIDTLVVHDVFGASGDIQSIDLWDDTHNNVNVPTSFRLESRETLMRTLTNGSIKIYGTAERVTLTPNFIHTLVAAISNSRFKISTEGLESTFDTNQQVGNNFIHNYLQTQSNSGMVQQGNVMTHGPIRNMFNRYV